MATELTKEQKAEIRRKELAILKAQNQMLEEAKENIRNTNKLDEVGKIAALNSVDRAIEENGKMAEVAYKATKKEMDNIKFKEANPYYREKYEERLKVKGLSDDELHNKNKESNATVETKEITKKRRHTSKSEKKEFSQDIDLETKLMQQSYIKDDKEIVKENEETYVPPVITKEIKEEKEETEKPTNSGDYDFDFSSIPSYVQYDVIPLPSKGQCYAHKIGRVPVAYLTASDENLIASPNMYRDGKVIDVILDRKILDKRVKASELCKGDRDAIILWLRATGYGTKFPITATNPETNKQYNIDFDLSTLEYYPFDLKGDENGYFDYKTENGTNIKFKVLSYNEEEELKKNMINDRLSISAFNAVNYLNSLQECMNNFNNLNEEDERSVKDCILDLKDIIGENVKLNESEKKEYEEVITKQMIKYTMSVDGNDNRGYIENYINNMRAKDAYAYRTYVLNNKPGVDFNITIKIPESDGGGSFTTFLAIDDTIFLNI